MKIWSKEYNGQRLAVKVERTRGAAARVLFGSLPRELARPNRWGPCLLMGVQMVGLVAGLELFGFLPDIPGLAVFAGPIAAICAAEWLLLAALSLPRLWREARQASARDRWHADVEAADGTFSFLFDARQSALRIDPRYIKGFSWRSTSTGTTMSCTITALCPTISFKRSWKSASKDK